MLHSRLLRYLDEVARVGSIRKAAQNLNVSASSVNRRIILLEEHMGTPIFHRLPRRLRLTAAGELVIAHIRETLKGHRRMEARIEQLRGVSRGNVRICAMHGIAGGVLPPILAKFHRDHPGIVTTVTASVVEGVVQALLTGDAHIGLAYAMPEHPNLTATAIYRTRLGAVVAPHHPLARRQAVRLADCLEYPTVLADPSLTIHRKMIDAFSAADIDFHPDYVTNSVELMKSTARSHHAVTFLSRIDVAEDVRERALVFVPIVGGRLPAQSLALVRHERSPVNPAVSLLEEAIRAALSILEQDTIVKPR